jgi:hypothetical protein
MRLLLPTSEFVFTSVGDVVLVSGWVVSVEKRKILAEATITSEDGAERAHAWGVFLTARQH